MDISQRYETLRKYMEEEFGVTPENIDEKLQELKVQFYNKIENLESQLNTTK